MMPHVRAPGRHDDAMGTSTSMMRNWMYESASSAMTCTAVAPMANADR